MTYITKTADDIKDSIEINTVMNVTQVNDINPGSVLDVLITAISEELGIQYNDLDVVNNSAKIDTATDSDLEQLGKLVGVTRNTGDYATGNVSFIRNTPASSSFIIPAGTIVATAPNTMSEQYSFTTNAAVTFPTIITNEEHTYTTGTDDYYLNQKIASSITSITGIVGGSAHTFIATTDYILTHDLIVGDYIHWVSGTRPDTGTVVKITYVPLSIEAAVTATNVGIKYNLSAGQITYKISSISQVDRLYNYLALSNGIDVEDDTNFRDRIQNASTLQSRATKDAIIYNLITEFDYIGNVTVYDLPIQTAAQEEFVFHSGTTKYALSQKVAINDANLIISNTSGGSADYIRNTDYTLNTNNEIVWDTGETNPGDTDTFYVTQYKYNKLGYADVLVVGKLGELNPAQMTEIQEYLDGGEIRAVGTVLNVYQPDYIAVDIEMDVTIKSGYVESDVTTAINTALEDYFSTLTIGEDILFARVIGTVINVDGVENVEITDIGGGGANDYAIAITEVGEKGTITVNYI